MRKKHARHGFTLIELLIVIAIIAILMAIIFVAIDPVKRGGQARDARRYSEINSILNATLKYGIDNEVSDWNTALGITDSYQQLGTADSDCHLVATGDDCTAVDPLSQCLDLVSGEYGYLVPQYLSKMPYDPKYGDSQRTGYAIRKMSTGNIEVVACEQEQNGGTIISISR